MHRGRSSLTSGRRSSAGPLRIKQDGGVQSTSSAGGRRSSAGGRRSSSDRDRGRKSVGKFGRGRPTSRPSSGYGRPTFGGHDHTLKDPRTLNSRSFMQREIKDIIEFLTENGYSHPLSVKLLTTPTTKDFLKIFQFIYGFLDPKYTLPAKPEEEIPQVFKTLKYPFTISKSQMFTVGSPHTWPHILGALHWLMCSVKFAFATDPRSLFDNPSDGDDFEGNKVSESEFLFNYYENTYSEFLKGVDTFEKFEQDLAENMKLQAVGATGNLEHLAAEEQRLATELQLLEQEPCKLTQLHEQAQMMSSDNERFHKYLQELAGHKRSMEQKCQDLDLQLQQTELESDQSEAEKNRLEHCLTNQELSASDVQRLYAEMRQLTNMLDDLEKGTQELDQEIWNEEKQIAKKQEQLEQQVSQYNSMARTLKLIPPTAENAHGVDYELRLNFHSMSDHAGMMDFNSTIKPALVQLKKQINDEVLKQMEQKLSEEEALEQVTEMVETKTEEYAKQETRLQRFEKDIQSYKEKSKDETRILTEQFQSIETKLCDYQRHSDMDLAAKEQEFHECQIRAEQRVKEMKEEKENYQHFLFAAITQILEHKALIQNRITELKEQAKAMIAETEALELPEPAPGTSAST
ncbi:kinetochore protein NDC80 homolog [Amphiura filiformis]|uniref:kinetochore protein NDC80 homolog n=1 Tax=Amphiura filiformis TaxID=82378 RepID=UPI003B2286B6